MRLSRTGSCIAIAGAFLILRLGFGYVTIGTVPTSPVTMLLLHALAFVSIAVLMLIQLGLTASLTGLGLTARRAALLLLTSLAVFIGVMTLIVKVGPVHLGAAYPMVNALRDLSLLISAVLIGYLVSFIIHEPNILLPAGICAALVDFWGVNWGFVGHMLKAAPQVVAAASVQMPTPVPAIAPGTMIGMGDFLFLGIFFGVMYRFSMNVKGAFWLGYALLTLAMFLALSGLVGALPALVPMVIAVLATNARYLKLSREEWFAVLYTVLFLIVIVGIWLLAFRGR